MIWAVIQVHFVKNCKNLPKRFLWKRVWFNESYISIIISWKVVLKAIPKPSFFFVKCLQHFLQTYTLCYVINHDCIELYFIYINESCSASLTCKSFLWAGTRRFLFSFWFSFFVFWRGCCDFLQTWQNSKQWKLITSQELKILANYIKCTFFTNNVMHVVHPQGVEDL